MGMSLRYYMHGFFLKRNFYMDAQGLRSQIIHITDQTILHELGITRFNLLPPLTTFLSLPIIFYISSE